MDKASRPRTTLRIEPMHPGDIPEVQRIEQASFISPWNLHTFYGLLSGHEDFRALVARETSGSGRGRVLGYAAYFDLEDELHLISLAVSPDRRRRGVGGALMREVLGLARGGGALRVTLELRVSNRGAEAFYAGLGFQPVAYRRNYYEDNGEDATVMLLDLAAEK